MIQRTLGSIGRYLLIGLALLIIIYSAIQYYVVYKDELEHIISSQEKIAKIELNEIYNNLSINVKEAQNLLEEVCKEKETIEGYAQHDFESIKKRTKIYISDYQDNVLQLEYFNVDGELLFRKCIANLASQVLKEDRHLDFNKSKLDYNIHSDIQKSSVYGLIYNQTNPVVVENKILGFIRVTQSLKNLSYLFKNQEHDSINLMILRPHSKSIIQTYGFKNNNLKKQYYDQFQENNYKSKHSLRTNSLIKHNSGFKTYLTKDLKIGFSHYLFVFSLSPYQLVGHIQSFYIKTWISEVLLILGTVIFILLIFYTRKKYLKLIEENKYTSQIKESEKRFKTLFNNAVMPMGIHQNGKFVLVNKAGLKFIEAENFEEIKDLDIMQFVHPDNLNFVQKRVKKIYETKSQAETVIETFITLKGKERLCEISSYYIDYEGKPAIQIMLNDITERHNYIKQLQESEEKYRTIFNRLDDAVILIKDYKFIDCNSAAADMYGFSTKVELIQKHPGELSPETQLDGSKSVDKAKEYMDIALEKGFHRFDWQHKKTNGEIFWMDVALTTIIIKGERYIHVFGRDISERKKIEKEYQLSQNHLNSIILNLPLPLIIYNQSGEITFMNKSVKNVLQYSTDTIKNSDDWWEKTISNPDHRKNLRENWEKAVNHVENPNDVVTQAWDILDLDGNIKSCEFNAIKIGRDTLVAIVDMTTIVQLNSDLIVSKDKAEESNRLKSAFLANLSHEVRTPLNGIMGFTQLLTASDLSEEERESYADIIQKSSLRLMNMIEDIINISKIDANQVEVETSKVNLHEIITELIDFHSLESNNKGLELQYSSDINSKKIDINTDAGKLKQILSNIIGNAIKYTEKGYIKVSLEIKNKQFCISIKDSGYGIKAEKMPKVFERFIRLEETAQKTEGTGLGLAISKAYANSLNMDIHVESEYGTGSTFTLTPMVKEHKEKTVEVTKPKEKQEEKPKSLFPDLSGKKILIAEDEDLNYLLLKLFLEESKAKIIRAHNGKEAVDYIESHDDVSLIFMDIKMPIMDGMEAMKIIKSTHKKLPIIAQTAFTFSEDKEKAMRSGFDDYMSKPLNKESIIQVLGKYFY